MSSAAMIIRAATPSDIPALERLIDASARALGGGFYSDAQIEAAIAHIYGIDTALIADGSYLVAQARGALAGCGGWSARATLFGGDDFAGRVAGLRDAARIRAFFVAPEHERQGIATALLRACEAMAVAVAAGFRRLTLMATRPGVPFYAAHGYHAEPETIVGAGGTDVPFVPMHKTVLLQSNIFTETQYSLRDERLITCDSR